MELKFLAPTAILGYGFPERSFRAGLERGPDFIAVDAGSTDPGPYYLGAGVSFTNRQAVKRDLNLLLRAGKERGIPVLIGTAGGAGACPHLRWTEEIVAEIAAEADLELETACIAADIPSGEVLAACRRGEEISPLGPVDELDSETIAETTRIVAQMGVEPFVTALAGDPDLVLAGRAYDPAVFAAPAVRAGFPRGPALHLGKILECASIAADPGSGSDCMLGTLSADGFVLEPLHPERRCTVASVAAHTLYEKEDPYRLAGPGGMIDLRRTSFEQLDARRVRVAGSRFQPSERYAVKLEGARKVGYRTVSIAGTRDPILIGQIEEVTAAVRGMVAEQFDDLHTEDYDLLFRLYGKNGVMGDLEPEKDAVPHELGIVIEAVAPSQDLAASLCSFARSSLLHYGYPGRKSTAGNLAFPYSPSDLDAGEVYEFSLHHLWTVSDPEEYFPVEYRTLGGEGEPI